MKKIKLNIAKNSRKLKSKTRFFKNLRNFYESGKTEKIHANSYDLDYLIKK